MNSQERAILDLIQDGFLSIDSESRVWRHYKWINYNVGYTRMDKPTRAELTNGKYYEIHIKMDGKEFRSKAHRIVWMHFNGDIPTGLFINHINGNGKDNRLSNIELVTQSGNTQHAYRTGLAHGRPGTKHHLCKLTEDQVIAIRREYALGNISQDRLGKKYSISQGQVGRIVRGDRWKTLKED